ncbi:carboxypeptidase regulatory-like domain-containing protein [Actinoplanes sp. NPDC051346]|uniref:carboxypeptidase regulatory-like domain-containing protein n=1 Tax=Actinoplanes sp. NPDC051346 TaxID=3155048 RepID=UPI00343D2D5F
MGTRVVLFYKRAAAATAATLLSAGLAVVGFAQPAVAGPSSCELVQADEVAASRMAVVCQAPVEVLAERTEYAQVFSNPDGSSTLEQSVEPQRVRQGYDWVPVDTTLTKTAAGVSPRAAVLPMTFSGGGDTLIGRLGSEAKELALSWPSNLPAPELAGDTAVYRDVLPEVDLQVTASVTGFSEVLVVHTREAAENPELKSLKFGLSTKGLEISSTAAGGLRAQDTSGVEIFTAPAPVMWDSTPAPEATAQAPGPQRQPVADAERSTRAVMPLKVSDSAVTITPDMKMLADPRTRFPVYIDPQVTGRISGNAWTSVFSNYPTTSFWKNSTALFNAGALGAAGAGRTENCSGCADFTVRSFFRMDTSKVTGKVSKAEFRIQQMWSWTCKPASNAKVWKTGGISSSTTWKNQPTWHGSYTAQVLAKRKYGSVHGCDGPGEIEFDVTKMVTSGASTVTLGLRAADEGTKNQWKRFKHSTAKLIVTHNKPPAALSNRKSDSKDCVVGAGRPYVLWTTDVKLTGYQQDPDAPKELTTYFYWWVRGASRSDSNRVQQSTGNKTTVTGTVPNGRLTDGATYVWQAKTSDGVAETWSGTCEFTVDKTPPPNPGAITSAEYSATNPSGGVGQPGTFKVAAPSTRTDDVVGYAWTLDSGEQLAAKPLPMNTDRSATLTLTPTKDGVSTLRVWTKDRAGRFSAAPSTYTFTVRAGMGPAAEWTFEEAAGTTTATDASGHGNTATLAGNSTRVPGRGNVGNALSFNANGYAATAGPATYPHPDTGAATTVRTDGTYTVATWVKINNVDDPWQPTAVSAVGTRSAAFRLGFAGQHKKWVIALSHADIDNPGITATWSDSLAVANKWTHLAGVYDAATKKMTLYVNGVAQSSTPTVSATFHANGPIQIGRRLWNGADDGKWRGLIDDVRVYNYAVTPAKIADLAVPQQPAISFPDGAQASAGGTLAIKFDAGGDTNVTRFKYSVDGAGLGSTVNANAPGGTATLTLTVGTQTGDRQLYAAADNGVRTGPANREQFTVLPGGSLSGSVLDAITWAGTPGATVTMQPGGHKTTTDADGGYAYANIPRGAYTVHAASGGRCGMAGSQPFLVDGQGLNLDLLLYRKSDQLGHTCAERTTTFATGTTVLPLSGDNAIAAVTLPFAFPFYGGAYRTAWVDTNGLLSFTDPGRSHPNPGTGGLIAAAEPNAVVAAFWDDLVVDSAASVRTTMTGTQAVVEWRNVHRKANTAQRLNISVTLSLDGTVTINYSGLDNAAERGESALVGIEAPTGDDGFSYAAQEPVLADGNAIVFTRPEDAPDLEVHSLTGKVTDAAGAAVSGATVTLDPSGLSTTSAADGTYAFHGVVADSYTVTSRDLPRCGNKAEIQVELAADTTTNLQLGPDYGSMGYRCTLGTGGYVNAGTKLALTGSAKNTDVTLPFSMQFHGASSTVATVHTDGRVAVGGGHAYPFWDDVTVDAAASMWTQTLGTAPNRSFVIEWRNVLLDNGERTSFETILHENGTIAFHYAAMTTDRQKGAGARVGIEAKSTDVAQDYSVNTPTLTANSSITYQPAPPGVIAGIVTETNTTAPIAGATVTLTPGGRTVTTGADGSYQFTGVTPGPYQLTVSDGTGQCPGPDASAKVNKAAGDVKVDLSLSRDPSSC